MTETTMKAKDLIRYLQQIGGRMREKTFPKDDPDGGGTYRMAIAPDEVYIRFPQGTARYDTIYNQDTQDGAFLLISPYASRMVLGGRELILVDTRDEPAEAVVIGKGVYQTMIDVVNSFAELAEEVARTTTDQYYCELNLLASQATRNFLNFYGMEPTQFITEEEE